MAAVLKDRSSMYSTLDYWVKEISPKYFDIDNISMSRIGLFGYMNEVMADSTSDIINENSVLFNEIFFKKAQLPESILAYAAQYRIEDINAKPAKMQFLLGINEEILLSSVSKDSAGNVYFIIDSDSEIIVEDDFKYMLDYNIKVSVRYVNGKNIYSAQYVMDKKNGLSDIKNPYLKVTVREMNGFKYLYIIVEARQIEKTIIEQTIFNEDLLSFVSKDFSYTGTLADFNIYYKGPNDKEFTQIQKLIIDSAPVDDKFCYYQYKDDNTINISFSTLSRHFKPEFNSVIRMEVLTTRANAANFAYAGNNVLINLKSEKYDYKKVIMLAGPMSNSTGAEDRLNYEELKDMVSHCASTSNNIGTTIDLNKYFSELNKRSKLTFVKKRDDILDRLFTGYMLMTDSNDTIIPCNTLDVHIGKNAFDAADDNLKRYVIKAGSKFVYKPNGFEADKVTEFKSTDKFRFSNPMTIVVNKSPLSLSYYMNSIEKEYITDFSYMNELSFFQFITNKVKIKRDAINGDDFYDISFSLIPNIDDIGFEFANLDSEDKFVSSNGKVKIFGILNEKDQSSSNNYIEFEMYDYDKTEKRMEFSCKLKTDDYISATNKLRIVDSIKNNGQVIHETLIEATEMKLNILIMYNDTESKHQNNQYSQSIPEGTNMTLTNAYTLSDNVNLINDMTDIMRSTIKFNLLDKDKKDYEYFVRNVPLTNYQYIKSKESASEYIKEIFDNADRIREALKLITNNFSIDLKMYNTYGKSRYYYIQNNKDKLLDNVNLSIGFTIKLNPANTLNNNLQYDIRRFIKDYIEKINKDNNLYVSNLITSLQNKFRDIIFIEFKNINEYDNSVQSIEQNFPTHDISRKNDMIDFVPEYINVAKSYLEEGIVDYKINITFI